MEENDEPLDVLDLPQLYQRPSASALLITLADLSLAPLSWDKAAPTATQTRRKITANGIPAYLTKIVASPLLWIESEEDKERIWETASQRLSERSGRSGMSNLTRSFHIPLHTTDAAAEESSNKDKAAEIIIHEPAMTADNLGLKTWASSYLLAKRLPYIRDIIPSLSPNTRILELGSGTGLVGLAAAAVFQCPVLLTDLPDIVPNLEKNIQLNAPAIAALGNGQAQAKVLDWSDPSTFVTAEPSSVSQSTSPAEPSFSLILSADPIYSPSHPGWLAQTISHHLSRDRIRARVVIELPLREFYADEREGLKTRLRGMGLRVLNEGEEVGFDDWMGGEGEGLKEVRCWWSIWGWG